MCIRDSAGTDGTAPVRYISYNSMDVEEGTLFICKGANFRPQYLDDAIEKGAFCYVAENEIKKDFPHIIVSDMRKAMSEIGRLYSVSYTHLVGVSVGFASASSHTTYSASIPC